MSRRTVVLTACAVLVAALLGVAVFAPLPFTIMYPGITANTLGSYPEKAVDGKQPQQVITITGAAVRQTSGALRMTTIEATAPQDSVSLLSAIKAWPNPREAVVPHNAVYGSGQNVQQVNATNQQEMTQSQTAATTAALGYLHLDAAKVKVTINLADVGGPSAGLMFTLGIIDQLDGNGTGKAGSAGDLTNGADIAGTGEIDGAGKVSQVGGVALKTKAAARDGATVFLVPSSECSDARADTPSGLRLIPVDTLDQALNALKALQSGSGAVPSC
ncbi:S16 family serine protease [Streptacidiphilus carbonis]|uniref:S16 family serine protease n=1 Tax=Streptacidiphilus carbonis TaxID=105422 RepID=UPI0005A8FA33|nr:S16 family serine protease [Streptacidiphilus carbonis]